MSGEFFVDRGYRTGLGVSFYDRVGELELLGELLEARRTIVVYGPRNVGKSELVRYHASKRSEGEAYLIVDARRRAARRPGLEPPSVWGEAVRLVDRILSTVVGTPSLAELVEGVARLYRSLKAERLVVVVDEFHLLQPSRDEALKELESVAGYLAKTGGQQVSLIITVSEGFASTPSTRRRLLGYSVGYMLVEGLDQRHMEMLYGEYSKLNTCKLGFTLYWGVFGGAPGYLVEACPLTHSQLVEEYIPDMLRDTVDEALVNLSLELREKPAKLISRAARILEASMEDYTVIENPALALLAEKLVEHNILYHRRRAGRDRYLPQLPIYAAAIQHAAEKGYERTSLIPAKELGEIAENNTWSQIRCTNHPSTPV